MGRLKSGAGRHPCEACFPGIYPRLVRSQSPLVEPRRAKTSPAHTDVGRGLSPQHHVLRHCFTRINPATSLLPKPQNLIQSGPGEKMSGCPVRAVGRASSAVTSCRTAIASSRTSTNGNCFLLPTAGMVNEIQRSMGLREKRSLRQIAADNLPEGTRLSSHF